MTEETKEDLIKIATPQFTLYIAQRLDGGAYGINSKTYAIKTKSTYATRVADVTRPYSKFDDGIDLNHLFEGGWRTTKRAAWLALLDKINIRINGLKEQRRRNQEELNAAQDVHDEINANLFEGS